MPLTRAFHPALQQHAPTRTTKARAQALHYVTCVFALCALYATVRYNILGNVAWAHLPLFIANKALSLGAVILFAAVYTLSAARESADNSLRKQLGLCGYAAAAMHSCASLLLMRPAYYPKLFGADGSFNARGEIMLLCGMAAFALFTVTAVSSIPSVRQSMNPAWWLRIQRLGLLALLPTLGHVVALGAPGWFTPRAWPGGLPPITLLAACAVALVFVVRISRRLKPGF